MELHLITKKLKSPDIQVKLNKSHSKVINNHIQISEKNFLQSEQIMSGNLFANNLNQNEELEIKCFVNCQVIKMFCK